MTTLVGICLVDLDGVYRHLHPDQFMEMNVIHFADFIVKKLSPWETWQPARLLDLQGQGDTEVAGWWEHIIDWDGNFWHSVTKSQEWQGHNVGKSSFICRKYLSVDSGTQYKQTLFRCKECKLPVCLKDWCNPGNGRVQTCADEHFNSANVTIRCSGEDSQFSVFPKEMQVQLVSWCAMRSSPNSCS